MGTDAGGGGFDRECPLLSLMKKNLQALRTQAAEGEESPYDYETELDAALALIRPEFDGFYAYWDARFQLLLLGFCKYYNFFVSSFARTFAVNHLYARFRLDGSALEFALKLDKFSGKLTLCVWVFWIAILMYCGNSAFIYANF